MIYARDERRPPAKPERVIRSAVVLHIKEDGDFYLRVFGDEAGEILVLTVDENCPRDRVYEHTNREPHAELKAIVGDGPLGHSGDGVLSDNEVQAIRAMSWRAKNDLEKVGSE